MKNSIAAFSKFVAYNFLNLKLDSPTLFLTLSI